MDLDLDVCPAMVSTPFGQAWARTRAIVADGRFWVFSEPKNAPNPFSPQLLHSAVVESITLAADVTKIGATSTIVDAEGTWNVARMGGCSCHVKKLRSWVPDLASV